MSGEYDFSRFLMICSIICNIPYSAIYNAVQEFQGVRGYLVMMIYPFWHQKFMLSTVLLDRMIHTIYHHLQ